LSVASQIIQAVMHETCQIHASSVINWEGKIFTINTLFKTRSPSCKNSLICGTSGIATRRHPEETTRQSLFWQ
jgi:hypothetical protein